MTHRQHVDSLVDEGLGNLLTGAVELAVSDRATVLASAAGGREFPRLALRDGEEVDLGDLEHRVGDLPAAPTVLMCNHGERAMGAASLLARAGHRDVAVLAGGPEDWAAATGTALATGT